MVKMVYNLLIMGAIDREQVLMRLKPELEALARSAIAIGVEFLDVSFEIDPFRTLAKLRLIREDQDIRADLNVGGVDDQTYLTGFHQ